MKRWIKLFVTLMLAVSIPLQGLAAVSMPVWNMSKVVMKTSMVMGSSHTNIAINKSVVKSSSCDMNVKKCCNLSGNKTCSDQKCSTCQLSVFQLPITGTMLVPDSLSSDYQDLISESYQTFPPALFHPPKLVSA